jgi:non-ribosomal peptide synthetase component F
MNPGGLDLESFPLDRRAASLDLVMLIIETSTALSVSLRYNSDLFDPSTIVRIGGHFESVLRNVVADNDLKLNGLKAILAEADRQQLIGLREERRNANLQMLKNIKRRPAAPAGRAPGHADHD